jgi:hypothetical protein
MSIVVEFASGARIKCRAVIVVPEIALADATYIRSFSIDSPVQSKHEFHTMAQIALIQFDDEEIEPVKVDGNITLTLLDEIFCLESGVVICRLDAEAPAIYMNVDQSLRKYLAIANRYCTRWVRLDI